jgi:hypothetical protein
MKRPFAWLFMAVLFIRPPQAGTTPAAGGNTSGRKLNSLRIEQFAVYNALGELSEKARIVIGLDSVQPKQESDIVLDFPGGTVADLLDMFVATSPGYRWTETDSGVIHVSRTGAHVSLLDVVMSYPGAVKRSRHDIWEDIAKRPEVRAWMQSSHCTRGELFNGKEFRDHNEPINIQAGSMTVAELLDQVASKSGVNYWAVLQSASDSPCSLQIILW